MQRTGFVCAVSRRRSSRGALPWLIGLSLAASPIAALAVSDTAFERTTVAASVAQTSSGIPADAVATDTPAGRAVSLASSFGNAKNAKRAAGNGVGFGSGDGARDAAPAPEPSSFLVFAAGLLVAARSLAGRSAVQPRLPVRSRRPAQRRSSRARRAVASQIVEQAMSERRLALLAKRALDIAGGTIGLLLALPIILVAALAIRLDSRGPFLFRQTRVGQGGREFSMWKLRTMVVGAEEQRDALLAHNEMDGPVFKMRHDPRVTRVGRVLRRFSIDELPQFWNVVRGEMSLVGPRPPLPCEVARYGEYERRRLSVKPGLTCEWQVSGRNEIGFQEWVRLDIAYAENWSLTRDLRLILLTVPAVMRGNGAS